MSFDVIISQDVGADEQKFWKAAKVWLDNPHVVNRRILANKTLVSAKLKSEDVQTSTPWTERLGDLIEVFESNPDDINCLQKLGLENFSNICSGADIIDHRTTGCYIQLQKLLPRNSDRFSESVQLSIIDKDQRQLTFICRPLDKLKRSLGLDRAYRIKFDIDVERVSILVEIRDDIDTDPSIKWLQEQFFPKFVKWLMIESNGNSLTTGSLKHVPAEDYVILYNELKKKYGAELVKNWSENTDPAKFVYEDIAIATYLLLLWEKERKEKGSVENQSFLDLGCGNGLLVHILASEGHPGIGIDLRKRKIWDSFPENTKLEVRTIIPSASSLFPETDWLIGNHSDELTPWIPVVAARSSYHCRFFLLPCCAYEFDGRKYQREIASQSQYLEYMDYVKKICEGCGFRVEVDKLRIPSTKRICLIGRERIYPEENHGLQDVTIQKLIDARSRKMTTNEENIKEEDPWSQHFKPRETVERVRNCTKLGKGLIAEIIELVTKNLLSKVRMIVVQESKEKWNAGGQIELRELAKLIPQEKLKELKNECGGLQTLLRNNGNIFHIVDGKVQLKIPGWASDVSRHKKKKRSNIEIKRKIKPCWFFQNHPNGCPLADEKCNFVH